MGIFVSGKRITPKVMYYDDDKLKQMYESIIERFDAVELRLERMTRQKDCLDGDKLLDNHDLCVVLGVTKRTLARYRQKKLVAYYKIDGRTYYKSSEIKDFLKRKGKVLDDKYGKSIAANEK